jgi:hypothetical protein
MRGNDPVLHDPLVVIDILEEKVQRGDPLHQAALKKFPFPGRNDPGHQIEREDPLRDPRIAIHVERDALPQKSEIDRVALGVGMDRLLAVAVHETDVHRVGVQVDSAVEIGWWRCSVS